MNISSRCEYACRAIIELALNERTEQPLTSVSIAERRKIPVKYLVHILVQLKRAGLVRSVRGAQGGYLLSRSPDDITLLDLIEAIDGPILDPLPINDDGGAELNRAWENAARQLSRVMREYRIRDIIDGTGRPDMYYI
ncbi:MAG TPA: Rrf2 family transcriptional regulator [Candidatus Hydrogenedentes bacterium]|jgi:Rrf2 family protein|nr:Rrf2 family transcriptional regulator [Candidatus Hydrogenedentota bacterium]HPJ99748.1 Rrf2 family transcriptional regulator [Candidatus Hydrogenedentota bacterium]